MRYAIVATILAAAFAIWERIEEYREGMGR